MEEKEYSAKIDNLESQVRELTHLVASLLKKQRPTSFIQEAQASSQANE